MSGNTFTPGPTPNTVRAADGSVSIVDASPETERLTTFIMLREGVIVFEGDAQALRGCTDPYIQTFLS